ncbi:unnamed protein product [Prunus brigantina]
MAIEEVNRHSITYWVQVSKIPLENMNEINARRIGASLGRVVEVDDPNQTEGYRGFLRLKVELNARKPLVKGFWIPRRNKTELRAEIRYERLEDYCYHCGKLGHSSDLRRFPHGGFGIFTTDLRAKALRPSLWRGVGENTGRNYHSNLSTLARGNQASEMERE